MSTTPVPDPPDGPTLVADLLSGDAQRIYLATWSIIGTRDEAALRAVAAAMPAIETAVADVDLGGALASNAGHLMHALGRAELLVDGACLCGAYAHHMMYDPAKESARGHVTIVGEIPVIVRDVSWPPRRICACTACGQRFDVEQGEYHYTWWHWRTVEEVAAAAKAKAELPVPTPPKPVTNPRSPARARRRRSSPSA